MFSKLKFNNLLISNKKIIQQGRAHTINKLIQALKKLQYVQEKYPENIKNKNRIRKKLACLAHLKKLKRAEIIKNVLLLNKNPTAVITNDRAAPEEIVTALLATNKIISDFVKKLRVDLDLNNSDDLWKEKLVENSKRLCKLQKTEMKRRKRQEIKQQKLVDRKRQEWLEENNSQVTKSNESGTISSAGTWVEENILLNNVNSVVVETQTAHALETTKATAQSKEKVTEKPLNNKNITQKIKKSNVNENLAKTNNKQTKKIQLNNTEKDLVKQAVENIEATVKDTSYSNMHTNAQKHSAPELNTKNLVKQDTIETSKPTHVIDSFFVTETGDNYLSTAVVSYNNDEQDEATSRKDFRMRKPPTNSTKKFNYNSTNDSILELKRNNKRKAVITEKTNEQMHPSWAAKQKFKPVISNFQGKKITFDDNVVEKQINSKENTQNNNSSKIQNVPTDLHPSWAAKQKLKPTITAFVGKKIVFDDDN